MTPHPSADADAVLGRRTQVTADGNRSPRGEPVVAVVREVRPA